MRHFPRTAGRRHLRRLAAASLAATLALGLAGVPQAQAGGAAVLSASVRGGVPVSGSVSSGVPARDPLEDRQREARKKVREAESDLHGSSRRMRQATERLQAAQRELGTARSALAAAEAKVTVARARDLQLQAELEQAEAELVQARQDLRRGKQDVSDQQGEVAVLITDLYQQGDPQLLAFSALLDARTPADLTRQAEVRHAIVDRENRAYQEFRATEVLLAVREDQVETARDEVRVKRQAAADQLARTREAEAAAQSAADSVAAMVTKRRGAQRTAARARAADQAALRKAEAQEAQIAEMLRRRAERALRARQRRNTSAPPPSSGGFLHPPVSGARLSSPYGWRTHPIHGYWGLHDGQDWAVACGTPMYAGADGQVVSSYWSDVYGHRLVIDHGAARGVGLATIFNHATRYTVGVGTRVRRGQLVGYVGSTGWSTGCHLHFTVMTNGKAVDPRNWL